MDEFIFGIILAVVAVILTYFITKSKNGNPDTRLEDKLREYSTLLILIGSVVKSVDIELYNEIEDVMAALNDMYDRGVVNSSDVEMLLDEAKDVFDRAVAIYQKCDVQ